MPWELRRLRQLGTEGGHLSLGPVVMRARQEGQALLTREMLHLSDSGLVQHRDALAAASDCCLGLLPCPSLGPPAGGPGAPDGAARGPVCAARRELG